MQPNIRTAPAMNRKERRAAKKDPSRTENIGEELKKALIMQEKGQLEGAATILKKIVKLRPDIDLTWNMLGMIALEKEDLSYAAECFNAAIAIQPANPTYYKNLGAALHKLDKHEEAIKALEKALDFDPNHDTALSILGHAYLGVYRFNAGEKAFSNSLKINPDNKYATLGIAQVYLSAGNITEANILLKECIDSSDMSDLKADALLTLITTIHKVESENDEYFAMIKDLEQQIKTIPNLAKADIYAALAKSYDDLGDKDTAFNYLKLHGDIRKSYHEYDPNHDTLFGAKLFHYFTKDFVEELKTQGLSDAPVAFIVAPPRSGTTLIEQVIHAHPDAYGLGEDSFLSGLLGHQVDIPDNKKIAYPLNHYDGNAQENHEMLSLKQCAEAYLEHARSKANQNTKFFVNKAISNIEFMPMILSCFPNAKFIFINRDPLDSCLSCYSKSFAANAQIFSYDLQHVGHHYRIAYELMDNWRTLFADNIIDVEYEAFVSDLDTEAKKLIDALGLEWNNACLEFYNAKRYVHTASVTQVRKPVYTSSIGRWKSYKQHLEPLAKALDSYCPGEFYAS